MFCTVSAILFWLIMACSAIGLAFQKKNYNYETWETMTRLEKISKFGFITVLLVDLSWIATFFILAAGEPALGGPGYDKIWESFVINITLPWIAPQVLIVIGFAVYLTVWGPKPTPKP